MPTLRKSNEILSMSGMDNLGPVRPILDRFWTDAEAGISEYEYFLEFELVVTCRDVA